VAGLFSVLIGSVGGFFQTSLGGLLAYSGVINGGYLLLLATAEFTNGGFSFGYYTVVYLVGTLTLVGVASVWGDTRFGTDFPVWGKLGVGVPLLVYYLTLNLGGLPVFPGFFAKLVLLKGLSGFGFFLLWAVVAASVIPAVYYVSIAVAALFEPSSREVTPPGWLHPVVVGVLVLGFNGVTTLLLTM
jgi:NADH-quinone oxidoreductase subunit N